MRFSLMIVILGGVALLNSTVAAEEGQRPWRVASDPQDGLNLTKVCLWLEGGRWVERDASNPSSCGEILIVNRDSRWMWPDQKFYSTRETRKKSALFGNNDGTFAYVLVLTPNVPAVLSAMQSAGAIARLEAEAKAGTESPESKACHDAYRAAKTEEDLRSAQVQCHGIKDPMIVDTERQVRQRIESQRAATQQAAASANRPPCSEVTFAGIAVGGSPQNLVVVKNASDVEDILARNPLRCSPSGMTQTYSCVGAAVLKQKVAYIISWANSYYQVATPIDLERGRKDAMLFIDRNEATCLDDTPPSLSFGENLRNFLLHHNKYR